MNGHEEAADYLDSDEVIAEYLTAAAEEANPDVFLVALGVAAERWDRSR